MKQTSDIQKVKRSRLFIILLKTISNIRHYSFYLKINVSNIYFRIKSRSKPKNQNKYTNKNDNCYHNYRTLLSNEWFILKCEGLEFSLMEDISNSIELVY